MKVLHYMDSFHFGGIERLVFELIFGQQKMNSSIPGLIVNKNAGEFQARFQQLGVDLCVLNLSSGFDLSRSKYKQAKKTFSTYDIVHLHSFNLLVAMAAITSKRKIVYTEHGNFGFGRKKKITDRLNFFLRKLFFRFSKVQICCNSEFTKQYVIDHFYKGKRLQTVHNGVRLSTEINLELVRKIKKTYEGKWIIGTSSRLAGFKKIDRLVSVFADFHKSYPDTVLMIVGEGPERVKIESMIREKNIETVVFLEGYQSEVTSYQSCFDVCVFPSENEPFGLVAIECLALSKPVLIFENGGGLVEIISKQETQNICKDNSKMIQRLKYYYQNRKDIEINEELLNYFSVERMVKSYQQIYEAN